QQVQAEQQCGYGVNSRDDPAQALDEVPLLREGQREMQEQSGLQQPSDNVRPVDRPVEYVEFPCELKRVKDERYQAKNIEVRGFGRGPAAQENIESNAEVNERDQSEADVN